MGEHIHEMLHVAAATLFFLAGVSALSEYRYLRERVVLTYAVMCLCSAAYACHVAISHNLPKLGTFWIPWTLAVLVVTFGATLFYLVTMQRFVGVRGRLRWVLLAVQFGITVTVLSDLLFYAVTGGSFLLAPIAREGVSAHQRSLGEGAYSLLPAADVVAGLFMLSFVLGVVQLLMQLVRSRSRDVLVYLGLSVTALIIVNDTLVAMSAYTGVYMMALTKAFEAVRIHRDIQARARQRVERRLRQAEKMEAIGRVAGGIAHDFNNVLTVIGGNIELAANALEPEHPAKRDLKAAHEGFHTGRSLVNQLLDVARSEKALPECVDIHDFLSNSTSLLTSMLPRAIKLETTAEPGLGGVAIAPGQLTRVLMNLVINARDAMPSGGTIEIRAHVATKPLFGLRQSNGRRMVVISVADQGTGIPEDALEHVFEPFYTTKVEQGGSGLGLATVYSIVGKAGGSIEVESEVGRGTRFHVRLPSADH